ncbi:MULTISPECIES: hypothetical protein [unclassified Kitasatospora]|uniref:hypothetical protein n=1 Tax=unclassified Kitasatospora TaxID=2633591 RepID=UPI0033EFAB02
MSGSDLLDPDGHGPARDEEEQELRFLLQQAAPHLAAPEDRMDRIRARAAHTRRRRRAVGLGAGLTGGLIAAALAAAPAVAPAPERGVVAGPAGTPSAVTSASSTPSGEPSGAVTPPVAPPGIAIRFPALPDTVVEVPNGWHARNGITSDPREGIGFLATQPLDGKSSCPPNGGLCVPLGPLAAGGADVTLQLVDDQGRIQQTPGGPATLTEGTPDAFCVMNGGTRELVGHRIIVRNGVPALIELTACLREPSDPTLEQVRQVLDSIRTAGNDSTPAKAPRG